MFRNRKALSQELKCKIHLLIPGEELEISYTVSSIGQDILNDIVRELDLLDRDYYGLKLHEQIQWIDPTKSVVKQTKGMESVVFELRFKYYPAEPALLANEATRYNLYLQLRLDLLEGRLKSDSQDTLAYLIACILQSELGDYVPPSKHSASKQSATNYVSEFKFVPNQMEELELAAIELHQSEDFQGLQPSDSELNFLKKACQLDTYGIDPYPVKDGNSQNHCLIGVNHLGISTFQDSKLTNRFNWEEIERIALDSKLVLIYCRKVVKKGEKISKSRPFFDFRCPSQAYAQNFWKIATEHRFFFTLESTPDLPIITNTGGLFKKNHKLKYTGRVEKDVLRDYVDESLRLNGIKRSHSLMSKSNDGPRWQGFQQGSNYEGSLNNIYNSDLINKTMPANLNFFREEDEDQLHGQAANSRQGGIQDSRQRSSIGSVGKDVPKTTNLTHRRSVLTAKSENSGMAIRRGSQIYLDTDQETNDFIKTTLVLIFLFAAFIFAMLLINDSDRPNAVSLLVKKMHLENVSLTLRENYYLPLKTVLRDAFEQLISTLDSRLI